MEDPKLLTVPEISQVLRVSKMTVYRLIKGGAFNGAVQIGSSYRVPEAVVKEFLKGSAVPGDGGGRGGAN